jgi:hypothetical protein
LLQESKCPADEDEDEDENEDEDEDEESKQFVSVNTIYLSLRMYSYVVLNTYQHFRPSVSGASILVPGNLGVS